MARHCQNLLCPALERDGVPAEYLDTVLDCGECGEELAYGSRPEPTPAHYRELVTIYQAPDPIRAHLLRGALEAAGIEAFLANEALGGSVGELPATVQQIRVEVLPEDAEDARRIALAVDQKS